MQYYYTPGGISNIYSGWVMTIKLDHVPDGLGNTLLIGEKFVHPDHQGETYWGDGTFWSGDAHPPTTRVAGVSYPLAQSDTDPTVFPDYINMPFGGAHPSGICQFVFCDGSVQALRPSINTTVLGHLANREDGYAIPSDAF